MVTGLVYIAAHMPDAGEKESEEGKRFPSNLSNSNAIKKTVDGFTYLERWFTAQANRHKVEVPGAGPSVYVSHSKKLRL